MRSCWAAVIIVCFGSVSYAQTAMSDLLSFPLSEEEMGVVLAREEYLATHKFNSPWLRELDFRIRPDELETSLTDYRLRFGILNPMEIKANRDYYKLLLRQQSFERKKTINSALKRRYQLIIEGYFLVSSLDINEQNLAQLKRTKTLLLEESKNDLGDLLAMEEEITKQELTINSIRRGIAQMLPAYQQLGAEQLSLFANDRWITSGSIREIIQQNADNETLDLLSDQQQLERETSMLEINKAEAFSNLGFVQTEYDTEGGDTRDEQIRFQFGIQIPIFNTDRPDNQRRELELIEERAEYVATAKDEQSLRSTQALAIVDFLKDWELLEDKSVELEAYQEVFDEIGGDLKQFRQLREYRYYLEMKMLRTRMDIYTRYIDFLSESGELADQPYQNFLSDSLESFELVPN